MKDPELDDDKILQMAIEGICSDCKGSSCGCESYDVCDAIQEEIREIKKEIDKEAK